MKTDHVEIERIREAKKGFALTGAGISAPSGIPTFRGKNGYWKGRDPRELASQSGFKKEPQIVWDWYQERRKLIRNAGPNNAHRALKEITEKFEEFYIITQNVDNLHQLAGSDNVIELHGNIFRNKCNNCGTIFDDVESESVPECNKCGGLLRPDVVWFGEPLPGTVLNKSLAIAETSDICFVIGTSAMVQPAASLPLLAHENNAFVIEFNSEETVISSYVDINHFGDVSETLPHFLKEIN